MNLKIISQPNNEPIEIEDFKKYLRIDHEHDDEMLASFIKVAREIVETRSGQVLLNQIRQVDLCVQEISGNKGRVLLLGSPFIRVEETPKLIQGENEREVSSYQLVTGPGRAQICFQEHFGHEGILIIKYKVGYGEDIQEVPAALRQAVQLLAGFLYQNRVANQDQDLSLRQSGVMDLIAPYCIRSVF